MPKVTLSTTSVFLMLRSTKKHKPRSGSSRSSSSREDLFRSHSPSPGSGRSTPNSLDDLRQPSPSKEAYASPDRRSIASISTAGSMTPSSTVEALATPSLPMVVCVKNCSLVKSPPGSAAGGWGFVLRGTTSEYKQGTKVYTCHVDSVKADGAAMVSARKKNANALVVPQASHFLWLATKVASANSAQRLQFAS